VLKKFKTFAMRGNIVDLAVGVIIGVAFSERLCPRWWRT